MLKNTSNPIVLGIFLGLIGAIAAIILAKVAEVTKAPIKANEQKVISMALQKVLPDFDNAPGNDTTTVDASDNAKIPVTFFGVKVNGKLVGVAGQSYSLKGYAGKIEVMVGLDLNGKIRTVLVTSQKETPGLGTVVCERKKQETILTLFAGKKEADKLPPNKILDAFDGHSAAKGDSWPQPWKVEKDGGKALFMTGATISSRAVTEAVYRVAQTYIKQKKKILAALKAPKMEAAK